MPRTTIAPQIPVGPHPAAVAAGALDIAMAAADAVNKNQAKLTGKELILMQNAGAAPVNVTITSTADPYGRTKDIAAYSLGVGEIAAFWAGDIAGWLQSDGYIYFEAASADVKFAVLRMPV